MAAGAHPLGASPRAELACLRDRRAKTLAWKARMSPVSYLHRGLQAKARRARIAISMTERSCGIAFPVKCPEPHSGGAGRKSRKNRLFLSLRIPYFPHFTRWPPHFPQNPLSFLPFPTRGIWPVAPGVVASTTCEPLQQTEYLTTCRSPVYPPSWRMPPRLGFQGASFVFLSHTRRPAARRGRGEPEPLVAMTKNSPLSRGPYSSSAALFEVE